MSQFVYVRYTRRRESARVRTPQRHVAKDGAVTWKVRFRRAGKQTNETFYDEDLAEEFCD
jgi:hypothetical protein